MEKRRIKQTIILAAAVIAIIILVIAAGRIIDKYTPSKEKKDLYEYYGLSDASCAAIVLNHEIIPQQAVFKDGAAYLDYETLKNLFNSRFYWDANENLLLYTTAEEIVSAAASGKDYFVAEEKKQADHVIVYADAKTAYISMDYIKMFTDLDYRFYPDPNRIVVITDWSGAVTVPVEKDTQIRYRGGIKSPILKEVLEEDTLILLQKGEDWDKVATEDGIIGYIQNKRLGKEKKRKFDHSFPKEEFSHILKEGKINMAWHQVTSQEANGAVAEVLAKTKGLNVISPTWFYLNDNDGGLMSFANAEYVQYCHGQGIEVWALVSNLENKEVDSTEVLSHTSKRKNVIGQLLAAAAQYGLDGINVDFEALDAEAGDGYVQLIRELSLECEKNGIVLSVDNYVPTEYTAFYDRKEQALFADYVIMMGYDEHYAGSNEGSVSSIGFVKEGILNTLKEVPANQMILAAPFYTRIWIETPKEATDDVEAAADDYVPYELSSKAVGMEEAWNTVSANGAKASWSEADGQYYAEYASEGNTYKVWLEDEKSMGLRLEAAAEHELAGMAFWKLGLEDGDIWDTVLKYMD